MIFPAYYDYFYDDTNGILLFSGFYTLYTGKRVGNQSGTDLGNRLGVHTWKNWFYRRRISTYTRNSDLHWRVLRGVWKGLLYAAIVTWGKDG